ncbi:MAG: beta-lactamase family protein [Propionibacterium sp.]|nr:beta-lactamase family protein [Propionibacterium sp.]
MTSAHDRRAAAVASTMRASDTLRHGATWALVSGPPSARRVHVDSTGPAAPDTLFQISSVTKVIATACTMGLVTDGALGLDDPVERWVPAWAGRRVLRRRHGPLDDTVAATRSTTVRDLLRMGFGLGYDVSDEGDDALSGASDAAGVMSHWLPPQLDVDAWMDRVAALPMRHQPGEGWLYQTSFDALTVVLEAATRVRFDELLGRRLLEPLGMRDTGYFVPGGELRRVPALWFPDDDGGLDLAVPAADPRYASTPTFPSASAGLLSTAADLAAFAGAALDGALGDQAPMPDGPAATMAAEFLGPELRWGLGVGIDAHGRVGWDGGTGASLWVDREADVAAALLTHEGIGGGTPEHFRRFWEAVRGAG